MIAAVTAGAVTLVRAALEAYVTCKDSDVVCECFDPMPNVTVHQSRYSFAETVGRLTEAIEGAGATLFANIDQAEAARTVGLALRPTTLLLFGNPKAGTALMDAFPLSALDLPLKLLVWEDAGAVSIAFTPMAILADRYDVVGKEALLRAMDGLLTSLAASLA